MKLTIRFNPIVCCFNHKILLKKEATESPPSLQQSKSIQLFDKSSDNPVLIHQSLQHGPSVQ